MKGSLSITVLILHLIAQDSQVGLEYLWLQVTPAPNTLLFGAGPAALTGLKGVFHWPKANLEWKTPRY
ncbi:MAG: hypothetical protein UHU21_01285, partial [Lachnospiraceae bacterium]|nr:hypothetical protein [Lachnospiraceae bacterium]